MQRACARKLFLRQLRVTTDLFSQSVTFASKPGGPPLTFHLSRSARLREPPVTALPGLAAICGWRPMALPLHRRLSRATGSPLWLLRDWLNQHPPTVPLRWSIGVGTLGQGQKGR
jgi:hypothetical protein